MPAIVLEYQPTSYPMSRPNDSNAISPESVRKVIANSDPVSRNLQITQSYHGLSLALDEVLDGFNLSWCAFATWASKEAGRVIRNEEVPKPLRRFLDLDVRQQGFWRRLVPGSWLRHPSFLRYIRCTVEDVASNVAEGNRLVYSLLAPLFASFLELVRHHHRPELAQLKLFLAELERDSEIGEALQGAFRSYYAARFTTDPKARAEHIFTANALVGWHEQIRLQTAIDAALRGPIRNALDDPQRLLWRTWPIPKWLRRLGAATFRTLFAPAIRRFEDDWARTVTESFMSLTTPGSRLELGKDVPPLPDGTAYPVDLRELDSREANEVVANLDRTPDTTHGSAARDWTRLADRMNYIIDYFRSRQQSRELLAAPFTLAQMTAIEAGKIPRGEL